MGVVRAFIALELTPEARQVIDTFRMRLAASGADVRWESAEKLHVTVKFLGSVEELRIPSLCLLMKNAADGFSPFRIVIEKPAAFPEGRHPRVLWVGCRNDDGALAQFRDRLDDALLPLGFEREARRFTPHVTIGRVKSERGLPHLLSLAESLTFEPTSASINRIVLLKSVLNPLGAEYSLLHSVQLPT